MIGTSNEDTQPLVKLGLVNHHSGSRWLFGKASDNTSVFGNLLSLEYSHTSKCKAMPLYFLRTAIRNPILWDLLALLSGFVRRGGTPFEELIEEQGLGVLHRIENGCGCA